MACIAAAPSTRPATAPVDPELWAKLTDIDSRAGRIKSLVAEFEQQKLTALLRNPLISTGKVRIRGSTVRWDTLKPAPSTLFMDQHEVRIYYPTQKTVEVYPLDRRLGELASSPLPRLDVLNTRFAVERIPVRDLEITADPRHSVALRLLPVDPSLREHLRQVRVLLDVASACIVKAEMIDSDGERTLLSFTHMRLNADVGDLVLAVPPGTVIAHPLEGLEGQTPPPKNQSK